MRDSTSMGLDSATERQFSSTGGTTTPAPQKHEHHFNTMTNAQSISNDTSSLTDLSIVTRENVGVTLGPLL
jgi:hypothetical protein